MSFLDESKFWNWPIIFKAEDRLTKIFIAGKKQ